MCLCLRVQLCPPGGRWGFACLLATRALRQVSPACQLISRSLAAPCQLTPPALLPSLAVVTGVQIHNWGTEFDGEEPNLVGAHSTACILEINS